MDDPVEIVSVDAICQVTTEIRLEKSSTSSDRQRLASE